MSTVGIIILSALIAVAAFGVYKHFKAKGSKRSPGTGGGTGVPLNPTNEDKPKK